MKRGCRSVLIGIFPNKYRANQIYHLLEWSRGWKPMIEEVENGS
jgi:hypothetical protein